MHTTTPARKSPAPGRAETTPTATPDVRIRRGRTLDQGRYLGRPDQPFAFVWRDDDEETVAPGREIVIQVSRNGPCAWEKGLPINLRTAFPGDRGVTRLANTLDDWQRYFVKKYDSKQPQRFYWGRFNQEGRDIARCLQALLIDDAVVRYLRPAQDPQSAQAAEMPL